MTRGRVRATEGADDEQSAMTTGNASIMNQAGVIVREGVRAIILTPAAEILLMRIRLDSGERIWITPGGGKEPGESDEACLRRELLEELGFRDFEIGPRLWRRRHTFSFGGRRLSQTDDYFVVLADRFEAVMTDPVEHQVLEGFRWWKAEDLFGSTERLTPLSLAGIVRTYLDQGPPAFVDLEVLID